MQRIPLTPRLSAASCREGLGGCAAFILLLLSFSGSAAVAASAAGGMAAAFGEGAAEASAAGVAAAWRWGVGAAADLAAEGVAAPSAVVIVIGEEGNVAAVAVGALLGLVGVGVGKAGVDCVVGG